MKRLDLRLVELGLAPTRSKAQQMIRAGEVEVMVRGAWIPAADVAQKVDEARVVDGAETLRYVSRGGHKLAYALDHLNFDVAGRRVLDLGLSTGGFADCCLQRGAAAVLGLDVGHDQLHAKLRIEPRLTSIEGLNVRDLGADARVTEWLAEGVDLVVADLSFISLTLIVPALASTLPRGTPTLLLVKPQFETDASNLNRRGIVEDPAVYGAVEARVTSALVTHGFVSKAYFEARPRGGDGNLEFFSFSLLS